MNQKKPKNLIVHLEVNKQLCFENRQIKRKKSSIYSAPSHTAVPQGKLSSWWENVSLYLEYLH